ASRSLFLDALINGPTIKHFIYSLNVDTGNTNAGWPVDVNATANYNGMSFVSLIQEERGALALVNGIVYVSYSGYVGDCQNYHGWVVGVDINNPSNVHAWATTAVGGGIWDTVVLPAAGRTCSWLKETPLTKGVTGWAAKRSFACKPDRPGPVR